MKLFLTACIIPIINWFDSRSGIIIAIATLALAIITYCYLRTTNKILKRQDEANLLKYFEMKGITKSGFDSMFVEKHFKEFEETYQKARKEVQEAQ